MKKTKIFIPFILLAISSLAQTTTNTNYYDQYGNKIGSAKGTIIEKKEFHPISQYVPQDLDAIERTLADLQAHQDRNTKYINDLIDWIFTLKTKSDEKMFLNALDQYYKKLRAYDGQNLVEADDDISGIELGIKEEIDKYNTRLKELPQKIWSSADENYKQKNYVQSIADYTEYIALKPNNKGAYINRAITYLQIKNYALAIKDYDKYIEMEASNSQAYDGRGWAKSMQKDYFGAISDYNKELELEPNSYNGFIHRGDIKIQMKDYFGAVSDFKKAIEIAPTNPNAHNEMAWALFLQNDFKGALPYANKAIELQPNYANAIDTRGCIYFGLANLQKAIQDFNKALELEPKLSNSYLYRGRAFYKLNKKQNACEDWSKAGELGKTEAYDFIQKYCNN